MSDVWRVVPLADAAPPTPTTEARARRWWRDLLVRWRGAVGEVDDPTPSDDHLEALDEAWLARLVPRPPVAEQRAALAAWREARPHGLLLRPDDGSWDEALDDLGDGGARVVAPPAGAVLGMGLPADVVAMLDGDDDLHLAHLERWWVRHHDGLGALRELLGRLGARRGPWSTDVAPWAWAWMKRTVLEARGMPAPSRPAPLDGPALRDWLGADPALRLRGSGEVPGDRTFRALAARAHGEPGIAAAIWAAAMRDGRERGEDEDGAQDDARGDGDDRGDGAPDRGADAHVWLRDPGTVALPSAATVPRDDVLLLHAVLLHGVADATVLGAAVGLNEQEAGVALRVLESQDLLAWVEGDRVRVAPAALPSVWGRLDAEAIAGVGA
jgi:hypothetical protein